MVVLRKLRPILFQYKLENYDLIRVEIKKDLGVHFDCKLLFDTHVHYICSQTSIIMGFIFRRCGDFTDYKTILILYYSLVRSIMEYCSQIWNPYYNIQIEQIENSFIPCKLPYEYRLKCIKTVLLYERRLFLDEIALLKIVN